MKKLNMYYVYDHVGETVIAGPIPAANDLVALIGFRDAYIKERPKNMPYNHTALELVRFATYNIDSKGCFYLAESEKVTYYGKEVMQKISEMCTEIGVDDPLVEEPKEE